MTTAFAVNRTQEVALGEQEEGLHAPARRPVGAVADQAALYLDPWASALISG